MHAAFLRGSWKGFGTTAPTCCHLFTLRGFVRAVGFVSDVEGRAWPHPLSFCLSCGLLSVMTFVCFLYGNLLWGLPTAPAWASLAPHLRQIAGPRVRVPSDLAGSTRFSTYGLLHQKASSRNRWARRRARVNTANRAGCPVEGARGARPSGLLPAPGASQAELASPRGGSSLRCAQWEARPLGGPCPPPHLTLHSECRLGDFVPQRLCSPACSPLPCAVSLLIAHHGAGLRRCYSLREAFLGSPCACLFSSVPWEPKTLWCCVFTGSRSLWE